MEEGDFSRQRRNVLVISIIIIVFNLGGGDINDFSFQGMKLKNYSAIVVMIWLAFGYVVGRYILYSQREYERFAEGFWRYVLEMPETEIRPHLEKELSEDWKMLMSTHKLNGIDFRFTSSHIFCDQGFLQPAFRYSHTAPQGYDESLTGPRRGIRKDVALAIVIQYMFPFALRFPHFSDVILPYLLALFAVLVAAVRWTFF